MNEPSPETQPGGNSTALEGVVISGPKQEILETLTTDDSEWGMHSFQGTAPVIYLPEDEHTFSSDISFNIDHLRTLKLLFPDSEHLHRMDLDDLGIHKRNLEVGTLDFHMPKFADRPNNQGLANVLEVLDADKRGDAKNKLDPQGLSRATMNTLFTTNSSEDPDHMLRETSYPSIAAQRFSELRRIFPDISISDEDWKKLTSAEHLSPINKLAYFAHLKIADQEKFKMFDSEITPNEWEEIRQTIQDARDHRTTNFFEYMLNVKILEAEKIEFQPQGMKLIMPGALHPPLGENDQEQH